MRAVSLLVLMLLVWAGACAAQPAPPPVRVESGLVQGVQDGDVVAYKGVPYAAPPAGPLRWRPPQPAPRWVGVKAAAGFAPICPQAAGRGVPPGATQSEDCLYLNVWAPAAAGRGRPVMVWLHGGGDDAGTASQPQFDGAVFARDGIVFVSVDYRLGALGWFAHPALTAEAGADAPLANYGLMDEIAALQWVQRNIRVFGGDPTRVTVAGESAGGEAVLFLMTTPTARGLFARAIVESGSGWAPYQNLAAAEGAGAKLATAAGAPANPTAAQLRMLPVAALLSAGGDAGVTIDGRLVRAAPAAQFAAGREAPVPLLIGSNSGEDSLLGRDDPAWVLKGYAADQLAALRVAYGDTVSDDTSLAHAIFRDAWMGAPARWFAARHAASSPAFLYQFAYVPDALKDRRRAANHGFEMLFVFKALARAPIPLPASTADAREMNVVHDCWVGFVSSGAPLCPDGMAWPTYKPATDTLMLFAQDGARPVAAFRKPVYDLLDAIEARALAGAGAGR